MEWQHDTLLGRPADWPQTVDARILTAIARAHTRAELNFSALPPMLGEDLWGCWELSWLDARGKPVQAVAELRVPAASPALIESKSLKLYLGGYAGTRFESNAAVAARIGADLSAAVGAPVQVALLPAAQWSQLSLQAAPGCCVDTLDLQPGGFGPPRPQCLRIEAGAETRETLHSMLLRSNCPVTGQPDWATLVVDYSGPPIVHATLLDYLLSYRQHSGFHEQCVERIWLDLLRHCHCRKLTVYARYTRRGGLDINPLRSTHAQVSLPAWQRFANQ